MKMTEKKDIAVKRGVKSPEVVSLREAMGMSKPEGYGSPTKVTQVQQNIKGAAGTKSKRMHPGGGLRSQAGYDTNTKVSVGNQRGSKKAKMTKTVTKKSK
jgi:hypothetical protein